VVAERLRGVTRLRGRVALRERETVKKKMIIAAIGGALLSGSLLGAGAANADVYYKNCSEARAAGVTPLYEGDPGYAPHLDRDNDGIACE
jgi:Excalibur calcium-binding domain